MGVILGFFRGVIGALARNALISVLAIALVASGGWGAWQYARYHDARVKLDRYERTIDDLQAERRRQAERLKSLAQISEHREQRRRDWQIEALKWKNRMAELIEENKDVAEWADNTYPAELD